MLKEVIKKGGKRESFKPQKIKAAIKAACKDGRVPAKRAKRAIAGVSSAVMKSLRKQKTVKTAALRKKILSQLAKLEPAAAKSWRRYEKRRAAAKRQRGKKLGRRR